MNIHQVFLLWDIPLTILIVVLIILAIYFAAKHDDKRGDWLFGACIISAILLAFIPCFYVSHVQKQTYHSHTYQVAEVIRPSSNRVIVKTTSGRIFKFDTNNDAVVRNKRTRHKSHASLIVSRYVNPSESSKYQTDYYLVQYHQMKPRITKYN